LENAALFSFNAAWQMGTSGGRLAAPASRAKPLAPQAIRSFWLKNHGKNAAEQQANEHTA
jgi:hypothetical protein